MKATKTAVAVVGLCAALMTSCNKKSYDVTPNDPITVNQQSRAVEGGDVDLRFTTGQVNATGIRVQLDQKVLLDMREPGALSLFNPITKAGLVLPAGTYHNLITTMDLLEQPNSATLQLRGTIILTGLDGTVLGTAPVDFIVTSPLHVQLNSGAITVSEYTSLVNLLNLKLDDLGADISVDMWHRALGDNPEVITVSQQSNPEIYRMMFSNLQTMLNPITGNPGTPQFEATYMTETRAQ